MEEGTKLTKMYARAEIVKEKGRLISSQLPSRVLTTSFSWIFGPVSFASGPFVSWRVRGKVVRGKIIRAFRQPVS